MRTILLGRPITAEEAVSCGLVCDLVKGSDLLQHTINLAASLAHHGQEALQLAKEAICRGKCQSLFLFSLCLSQKEKEKAQKLTWRYLADSLGRDDLFERNLYYVTFGTEEKRKGIDEFLASRQKKAAESS